MDITKNFPSFTSSTHIVLRKDQIYSICVYDVQEYENVAYVFDKNVFLIKNDTGHVIEEIKNDENVLENICKTVSDNTLSNNIFIDKSQNKVMQFPCVKIYTTKESALPTLSIYKKTLTEAEEEYTSLMIELKDNSQFINLS